jgi:protein-tyrosine phosphatase
MGIEGCPGESIVIRVTAFRVLFVCIGNVCRSPLGERLLAARVADRDVEVSSAGVGAMVGSPMAPEAAVHLEAYGGTADGFVSRQLTPAMVDQSDLVLTATKAIRSRVLEDSPAALRRTFTVLELAALLDVVAPTDDLPALVRAAAEERSRAALDDYDIPDPFGRGEEANALAAELMAAAVERIAKGLGA